MKKADTELTIGINSVFDERGIVAAQQAVDDLREKDGEQSEKPQKKWRDPRLEASDREIKAWQDAEVRDELLRAIDEREEAREAELKEAAKQQAHSLKMALDELKREKESGTKGAAEVQYEKEVLKAEAKVAALKIKAAEAENALKTAQEREAAWREAAAKLTGGESKKEKEELSKTKAGLEKAEQKREEASKDYVRAVNAVEAEKKRAEEAKASAAATLATAKKVAEDKRAEEERKRAEKAEKEVAEAEARAEKEREKAEKQEAEAEARAEKAREKAERAREKTEQKEEKGETKERELIESRAEVQRRIKRELEEIERDYKTSGRYTEKEKRLQADIYAQDWKALMARREYLQGLQNTPGMDSVRQSAINKKLRETDMQLRGLRDNMKRASRESQKAVVGLKPQGQQAKNKGWQGTLKRVEKAYVRLAQRAERQASK